MIPIPIPEFKVMDSKKRLKAEKMASVASLLDGKIVNVRTTVFRDANGELITAAAYQGKTIDVHGIIEFYDGGYQIKVFTPENIIIK